MTSKHPLYHLIAEVLEVSPDELTAETSRADLTTWDSVQHLSLVMSVESTFGIDIEFDDVLAIQTVGDLLRLIDEHQPATC